MIEVSQIVFPLRFVCLFVFAICSMYDKDLLTGRCFIYLFLTFDRGTKSRQSAAIECKDHSSLLTFSLSAVAALRGDAGQREEGTFVALSVSQACGRTCMNLLSVSL